MTAKDPLKGDPNQLQKGAAKLESQNYFIQGRTGKYEIVPVLILTLVMMAQRHNVIRLCHVVRVQSKSLLCGTRVTERSCPSLSSLDTRQSTYTVLSFVQWIILFIVHYHIVSNKDLV